MKTVLMILTVSALFWGGCSTTPQGRFDIDTRRISIITEPAGATVTQINPFDQPSTSLGTTPIQDRSVMVVSKVTEMKNMPYQDTKKLMEQVDNVVVVITKEGYKQYNGTLRTDSGKTMTHTIKLQPE